MPQGPRWGRWGFWGFWGRSGRSSHSGHWGRSSHSGHSGRGGWWALGVLLASATLAFPALAGEHVTVPAGPGAAPEPVFMSTAAERQRDGVTIVLRDHDPVTDTVLIAAWPAFGFTVCDRQPLRLFNAAAEVLEVPAADGHLACLGRIPARWVRETLVARVPMFNAPARSAQLDTTTLQLERLRPRTP
jgi:hypothetical protein